MSDFAATCLIWVLGIWLSINAVAVAALTAAAHMKRKPAAPGPEPAPELKSKRTWATEMGLRQPK